MKFLLKGVVKAHDYFIFDSWNDYIVSADSEQDALKEVSGLVSVLNGKIAQLIEVEEIKHISEQSANALMKVNTIKKINDSITQVIMY